MTPRPMKDFDWKRGLSAAVAALAAIIGLRIAFAIYAAHQPMVAVGALVLLAAGLYVYVSRAAIAWI